MNTIHTYIINDNDNKNENIIKNMDITHWYIQSNNSCNKLIVVANLFLGKMMFIRLIIIIKSIELDIFNTFIHLKYLLNDIYSYIYIKTNWAGLKWQKKGLSFFAMVEGKGWNDSLFSPQTVNVSQIIDRVLWNSQRNYLLVKYMQFLTFICWFSIL